MIVCSVPVEALLQYRVELYLEQVEALIVDLRVRSIRVQLGSADCLQRTVLFYLQLLSVVSFPP